MTHVAFAGRGFSRWGIIVGVAVVTALVAGAWLFLREDQAGEKFRGAYVIALDAEDRAAEDWRPAKAVETVRAFAAGATVRIPEGSRVCIVYADGRVEETGATKVTLPSVAEPGREWENFLALSLKELVAMASPARSATSGDVHLVSPVGVTRFTQPELSWIARPGTDYDVGIVDPADPMAPPRLLEKTRPPVAFSQLESPQKRGLQKDRLYEVHVRETGSTLMVGLARILVAEDATDAKLPAEPRALLREAVAAMAVKPTRTGDAWLALSRLPEAWAATELAVRLRMRVAGELGLDKEFARAQAEARALAER